MTCAKHPEAAATAFCRECGTPMCPECQRPSLGSVYCEVHAPIAVPPSPQPPSPWTEPATYAPPVATPYTAPSYAASEPPKPDESVHPPLALILGLIPGVGAIYNGQYAKGMVHAVVFGLLVSSIPNTHNGGLQALLGIMIAAWVFYMAFEAFHTARKRRYGVRVEEFSNELGFRPGGSRFPAGAVLLIGLGFLLLLDTTDIISIDEFGKYWPLGLILLGVYLLYGRLHPNQDSRARDAEVRR